VSGGAPTTVDVHVGDVAHSQLVLGNYNTFNTQDGVSVTVLNVGGQVVPRLRSRPFAERPTLRFPLLGRQAEMALAASTTAETPLQLVGPEGIGLSHLLKAFAREPCATGEGVVFKSVRRRNLDEIRQALYKACWESDVPYMPTPAEIEPYLADREVLIVLDDCEIDREDLELLLDTAPRCRFVVGSPERTLWFGEVVEPVEGLDPDAAVRLLERELGRPLAPEESDAAEAVIDLLDGGPQRLVEVAAFVSAGRASLHDLAGGQPTLNVVAERALSDVERRILALLGLTAGAALATEHVAAVTGVPDVEVRLGDLERRGWVKSASPRYRLVRPAPDAGQVVRAELSDRLLAQLTWAAGTKMDVSAVAEQSEAIEAGLALAADRERWRESLELAFAAEGKLAQSGAWVSWRRVLLAGLRAARVLDDRAAEAHMLHQLGSVAICLGEVETAAAQLREALRLREAGGNERGAELTRHNLRQLELGGPGGGASGGGEPPRPGSRPPRLGLILGALAAVAVIVVAIVALSGHVSRVTRLRPLAAVGPKIAIAVPGPDAQYAPGAVVAARYSCVGSGSRRVAHCDGSVPSGSPLDTSAGWHLFRVVAIDSGGGRTVRRVRYHVAAAPQPPPVAALPTISFVVPPARTVPQYPQGSREIAVFRCTDGSGQATPRCDGVISPGNETIFSGDLLDTSRSGRYTLTVRAVDSSGRRNVGSADFVVTQAESAGFTIRFGNPKPGAPLLQDSKQTADFTCTDPGGQPTQGCQGVITPGGPIGSGQRIDTSTPGPYTLTVTAANGAQESQKAVSFTVMAAPSGGGTAGPPSTSSSGSSPTTTPTTTP
jgi:hypothetical protein